MSDSSPIWDRLRGLLRRDKSPPPTSPPDAAPPATKPVPPQVPSPQPPPPLSPPAVALERPSNPPPRVTTVAAPAVDLVLGVDLGTSCSKVVIGDPGWKDKSYAVSFGPADGEISAWLHPTRFGSEANLKMRLMNEPSSEHVRDLLACYLAEVIRHSRSWFTSNSPTDYRRREPRWSLNLGFPDKSVKGSRLASAYSEIANVAVALASCPEPAAPELASRIRRRELLVEPFIPPSRVNLYPEIAAQLAGYVNSPHRIRGNLLLIDVGAGTLDVSTIILHGDSEQDIVSFHFCEVEELGVLRLYEKRAHALENVVTGSVRYSIDHFQDGSRPIPESLAELTRRSTPALQHAFDHVSGEFAEEIMDVALRCLVRFRVSQRKVHATAGFDPWGRNLRFFLTGGGCRSKFYHTQLADGPLEDRVASNFTRWNSERTRRKAAREGLLLERLPVPENLAVFPRKLHPHFDRLSVAYGLAFGGNNLMKITSATQH